MFVALLAENLLADPAPWTPPQGTGVNASVVRLVIDDRLGAAVRAARDDPRNLPASTPAVSCNPSYAWRGHGHGVRAVNRGPERSIM